MKTSCTTSQRPQGVSTQPRIPFTRSSAEDSAVMEEWAAVVQHSLSTEDGCTSLRFGRTAGPWATGHIRQGPHAPPHAVCSTSSQRHKHKRPLRVLPSLPTSDPPPEKGNHSSAHDSMPLAFMWSDALEAKLVPIQYNGWMDGYD